MSQQNHSDDSNETTLSGCLASVIRYLVIVWLLLNVARINDQLHRNNELLLQIDRNAKDSIHLQRAYNKIIEGIVNQDE